MSDTRRACSLLAVTLNLVLLVALEVAFEPEPLALFEVAFPCEDVGTGAVQEPAVVGNDHSAARERLQRVFQRAEGLHVQVVGRLIEQDQVAALLQRCLLYTSPSPRD